jgi:hypothetical protein
VATLFIAAVTLTAWWRGQLHITGKPLLADRLFIIILMVGAIPFVLLPNPLGKPYLLPAIPYVLLSCAALFPLAQCIIARKWMLVFVTMAVAVLLWQAGRFVLEIGHHLNRSLWAVTQVHDFSALIASHVKEGAVATLFPAIVLDAGSPIYPQLATGVFLFRSGDYLQPERVLELNAVSPTTLPLLLSVEPPAAVFVGTSGVDRPLLNWALQNRYTEVDLSLWQDRPYHVDIWKPDIRPWKPRLFVRPDEPKSSRSDEDPRGAAPRLYPGCRVLQQIGLIRPQASPESLSTH